MFRPSGVCRRSPCQPIVMHGVAWRITDVWTLPIIALHVYVWTRRALTEKLQIALYSTLHHADGYWHIVSFTEGKCHCVLSYLHHIRLIQESTEVSNYIVLHTECIMLTISGTMNVSLTKMSLWTVLIASHTLEPWERLLGIAWSF